MVAPFFEGGDLSRLVHDVSIEQRCLRRLPVNAAAATVKEKTR
jgi:hypothetical protein